MRITFHGAAREVTGSCYLVELDGLRLLLDCGMIQGGKERHERNREAFGFDPAKIDAVVLSHAHIDHSGRLPLLCKRGFQGPILATPATVSLAQIMLPDSARIQEEDARWKIKRLRKRNRDADWVQPLYTAEDAQAALERFVPVDFDEPHEIGGKARLRFVPAGHILGAAIVELTLGANGDARRLAFSGDLGVDGARLMGKPRAISCPDYLLIESTYGDRYRNDEGDKTELLYEIIQRTIGRGGKVVIPSFAVGRTQAVLARINDLVESGRLSGVPVYVDSPMAIQATKAFTLHPDAYSAEARRLLRAGDEPLDFPGLRCTPSVDESKSINLSKSPSVIISASGMATAGRIKHHLAHNISDSRSTIVFVGYQANGTLGRLIRDGVNPVRIFGDWHSVRADVEVIEGFSAHADRKGLLDWYEALGGKPRSTYVIHGEANAAFSFSKAIRERFDAQVEVPRLEQSFELD
jgi:metallo-beta-lactamase family protein